MLAKKLGVFDRLKLVGYVHNTSDYYKMADLFVFPSKREGLPVSVMEAIASELPIIVSNVRGSRDLAANYEYGEIVNSFDVEQWANVLNLAIN